MRFRFFSGVSLLPAHTELSCCSFGSLESLTHKMLDSFKSLSMQVPSAILVNNDVFITSSHLARGRETVSINRPTNRYDGVATLYDALHAQKYNSACASIDFVRNSIGWLWCNGSERQLGQGTTKKRDNWRPADVGDRTRDTRAKHRDVPPKAGQVATGGYVFW